MKILFLVTEPWEGFGGIAKFNRDLLASLKTLPQNPEVTTLSLADGKIIFLWKLWQTLRQSSFDLVVCGHLHLSPVIRFFCKKIPQKTLIIHGVEAWQRSRHFIVNLSINCFDHVIAVSEFTLQKFLSWASVQLTKLSILPNCVDLNAFHPTAAPTNSNQKILLTLARLDARERYKGIDEVLELLPQLSKQMPQLQYVIAGAGTDQSRLEQKCQTLHIRHVVQFAGFVPEAEKMRLYQSADVFVMPGYGEGFGIVYLEAMACGIPVIGSKLDGSREALLDGKLGQVINPHHPQELKDAIVRALNSPKGVRPAGLEYFSFENFQKRTHQIFQ